MDNIDGDWVGYFTYGDGQAKHAMELSLQFVGSAVSGRGIDDVGHFTVSGTLSGDSCDWLKSYDTHCIDYQGCLENGRIWGTWTIAFSRGGFLIWPRKGGSGDQREQPEEKPIEEYQPRVQASRKS